MFGRKIKLFRMLGFEVNVDASWALLALLIVWTLSAGYFPVKVPGMSSLAYIGMAVAAAIGLFGSVIVHEFAHSLVARRNGLPMKGITLFIFGGVAEMSDEPQSAGVELRMAIAGPATSVALSVLFSGFYLVSLAFYASGPLLVVLQYLAFVNFLLAIFNMIPAFPLDGGRVLRSLLWAWKKNFQGATYTASRIGRGIGVALCIVGILEALRIDVIGGLWLFLIGLFLRNAAQSSYSQIQLRNALREASLSDFVTDVVTVPPDVTLSEFVDDYVYRYHERSFPVVEDSKLRGTFSVTFLKNIRREEWPTATVGDFLQPSSEGDTVSLNTSPWELVRLMAANGKSQWMVVDGESLIGVVSLEHLLRFAALKMDLEAKGIRRNHNYVPDVGTHLSTLHR